jgi:hypothetical protein
MRERGRHVFASGEAEDRRVGGDWSAGGRVGRAGDRVDDQRAIPIDSDLYTGLRAGTDQRIDMTLNLFLYLTHRHPRHSPPTAEDSHLRRSVPCPPA